MGERTQFEPGEIAPNNGMYVEISESPHTGSVPHGEVIQLNRGDHFPPTQNKDRKWTHKKN
ncbi:MAG: YjzC family protein [Acidibacillus sp.]|uniref:YjzC family protein n=1 Tax=Sulfoacidibacillus ferrooxidans TaxID=2005001 RepID=A0A9X2ABI7_9BACL|nr:YjzC family protein [Sulfoacidibacillus ferrooxidans]MCI0182799.1 hypothetical protein [Sulfoacidibacillus ferrooxidans]MCY0893301.1 YjzC family protein [Acidibacillus sp.]